MVDRSLTDNITRQQRARLFRVATLSAGMLIHLVVCWLVMSIGHMNLTSIGFLGLASLSMSGFAVIAMFIAFEWNLSLEDSDMSLAQMLWALTIVVLTTHFVTELRPLVLLSGLALVVLGANRLSGREQSIFAVYGLALYGMSLFLLSGDGALLWVTELVVMIAFALVLVFGPVLYRFEMGVFENLLVDKNQELSMALEQIRDLAVKDELTGVYNRRHVMDLLDHEKALADRGDYCFSICFVDLDYFKRVNDRFGHSTGDQVLRNFADLACSIVREVDCVARMGGEEFLLVLSGTSQREAMVAAHRLAIGMRDMSVSGIETQYRITASMGVTEYRMSEDIQKMIDRADKALYDAKRTGRNRVVIAEELEQVNIG